jgi:hypothetical protein
MTAVAFDLNDTSIPDVRPLYYACWLFTEASANASRVLALNLTSSVENVVAWAVVDAANTLRIVVIHKNLTASSPLNVIIQIPPQLINGHDGIISEAPAAQLLILHSTQNVTSRYGIVYAGQTYDHSLDGKPVGKRESIAVQPMDGAYSFVMDPLSIAMLVIAGEGNV